MLVAKGYHVKALAQYNSFNNWGWLEHVNCKNDIEILSGDIRDFNYCKAISKGTEIIFHLAALIDMSSSLKEPSIYYKANVLGTLNVLEAMRHHNVSKIIYAASASCYGTTQKNFISENSKIQLNFPYAFTKYSAEQLIDHWSKVYGINYFSLRLFNVYELKSTISSSYNSVIKICFQKDILYIYILYLLLQKYLLFCNNKYFFYFTK
jgi:nucleoside-diphosphate-sugar epimerase